MLLLCNARKQGMMRLLSKLWDGMSGTRYVSVSWVSILITQQQVLSFWFTNTIGLMSEHSHDMVMGTFYSCLYHLAWRCVYRVKVSLPPTLPCICVFKNSNLHHGSQQAGLHLQSEVL